MDIKSLTTPQLQRINDEMDLFLFKEGFSKEPWDKNFMKYPDQFKKLTNEMVSYKRDLMSFFNDQYQNRWQLVSQHAVKADEFGWDGYFYDPSWENSQNALSQVLEKHNSITADLGILIIALGLGTSLDYSSQDLQSEITKTAQQAAKQILTTSRDRIQKAIQTSLELGESRADFENRLKSIFVNQYRGSFIAQDQSLRNYFTGKDGAAVDVGLTKKTWLGQQAKDVICGSMSGITVAINALFPNGLPGPLAHFGCRCDVAYS